MPTSVIHCLTLLSVLGLSWAVINNDNVHRLSVTPEYTYTRDNCLGVPEVTYVCLQCFNAGITLSVTSCCQDLTITETCSECLMNPGVCLKQAAHSNLQVSIMNSDLTEDADDKLSLRQARRGLGENIHRPSSFPGSYHTSSRKFLREGNTQMDHEVNKKWYSSYKYILSLFPQRLSYGHSVFLQGMMARKSKSKNKAKVAIAWMKKSGNYNNDLGKRSLVIFEKFPTDSKKVNGHIDSTRNHIQNYTATDDSSISGEFAEDNLNTKVKRQRISDSDFFSGTESMPDFTWTDLLAELYNNTPKYLMTTDRRDTNESNRFFKRLLLFIDTFKQAALDYFKSLPANTE